MAETQEFDEDLLTPGSATLPPSGSVRPDPRQTGTQSFVTLNYDRLLQWSADRIRGDLIANSAVSENLLFPLNVAINYPLSGELLFSNRARIEAPSTPSRLDRIIALLTRQESLALLEQLANVDNALQAHSRLLAFLQSSNRHLHTFASLVDQDLIGLDDSGRLTLTEFGERVIRRVAGEGDRST